MALAMNVVHDELLAMSKTIDSTIQQATETVTALRRQLEELWGIYQGGSSAAHQEVFAGLDDLINRLNQGGIQLAVAVRQSQQGYADAEAANMDSISKSNPF